MNLEILSIAHKSSIHNKDEVLVSEKCGCYFCLAVFPPSEIDEWVDDDTTALCPRCDTDSVIGSASGFAITPEFLTKMCVRWFTEAVTAHG